jgi:hypothetical protein
MNIPVKKPDHSKTNRITHSSIRLNGSLSASSLSKTSLHLKRVFGRTGSMARWLAWARKVARKAVPSSRRKIEVPLPENLVGLVKVIIEEQRYYHWFMFLATSPVGARDAHLKELVERIKTVPGDPEFALMIVHLQNPYIFEAVYRTIKKMKMA